MLKKTQWLSASGAEGEEARGGGWGGAPHVEAGLLKVEVEAGDLGGFDLLGHALGRLAHVERVPVQQAALPAALAVRLQHADGFYWIHRLPGLRHRLPPSQAT